jgi:hypothetical protein
MGTAYRFCKIEQCRLVHDAVTMLDARILQGFNNDIRDQLAHRIQTLL